MKSDEQFLTEWSLDEIRLRVEGEDFTRAYTRNDFKTLCSMLRALADGATDQEASSLTRFREQAREAISYVRKAIAEWKTPDRKELLDNLFDPRTVGMFYVWQEFIDHIVTVGKDIDTRKFKEDTEKSVQHLQVMALKAIGLEIDAKMEEVKHANQETIIRAQEIQSSGYGRSQLDKMIPAQYYWHKLERARDRHGVM